MRSYRILLCLTLVAGTWAPTRVLIAAVPGKEAQTARPTEAAQQPLEPLSAPQPLDVTARGQAAKSALETLQFQWATVSGAKAYGVEIDCYGCCADKRWCSQTNYGTDLVSLVWGSPYSHTFPSGRPGSWRVWAIDNTGRSGKVSPWSVFLIAVVDPKKPLPRPPETNASRPTLPFPIVMQSARPADPATGEACTWPGGTLSGPGVTPPRGLYTPEPEYGEISRRSRVNGGARVVVEIGADGSVKRACLLDAVQPDLGEQAVKAVKSWRFQPARKDGEAIPYTVTVETEFQLFPWPNR
jgi:TonB family protein